MRSGAIRIPEDGSSIHLGRMDEASSGRANENSHREFSFSKFQFQGQAGVGLGIGMAFNGATANVKDASHVLSRH